LVERGRGGLLTQADFKRAFSLLRQTEQFSTYIAREYYTTQVSWAIYTEEWMDSMAKILKNNNVLEVCAGRGVLINPMQMRGVRWTATEATVPTGGHSDLIQQEALEAVRSRNPDVVFASWIPYESTLDQELMLLCKEKQIPLILVGESPGGCTGSHTFGKEYLDEWEVEKGEETCLAAPFWRKSMDTIFEQYVLGDFRDVPVWDGIHDYTCVCFTGDSVIESVLMRALALFERAAYGGKPTNSR